MPIPAICPHCSKTIVIERTVKQTCPECGEQLSFADMQRKHKLIDARTESVELATAKDNFGNADFLLASQHFKKALDANPNSYSAQYFVSLCDIYLNESNVEFDVMGGVMEMIQFALAALSRSNAAIADKLAFISAMLAESKIIITRCLLREDMYLNDINEFRRVSIADLTTLTDLFKLGREQIMLFAPEVSAALLEIVDCAIRTCYRAVQTVVVGEELFTPSETEYRSLLSLCNDYCFFAQSLNSAFDATDYSPDFTQNYMFNEKVLSRFIKYDEENKQNVKKHINGNIAEYNNILDECDKALRFTYYNCYRAMCSRQAKQHSQLFFNGLEMLYRLLMPRVAINDNKKAEVYTCKYVDAVDYCDIMTRFLVDSFDTDQNIGKSLREFYETLYEVVDMYYVPTINSIGKQINRLKEVRGEEYFLCQKMLFDGVIACIPALKKYVDFSDGSDKFRAKLVKICKTATEDFLLLCDYKIEELEQSNFYRPILQISSAVMEETGE